MKVGDIIDKIFSVVGIKWMWRKIWGSDCTGCEKRKDYLNNMPLQPWESKFKNDDLYEQRNPQETDPDDVEK